MKAILKAEFCTRTAPWLDAASVTSATAILLGVLGLSIGIEPLTWLGLALIVLLLMAEALGSLLVSMGFDR